MSLGGVPCTTLPPMRLLSRVLVARIQKRIFLGPTYTMGFDWQPRTLLSSMGGISALHHLHSMAAPLFRCFGFLMGGFIILLSFFSSSWGVFILLLSSSLSLWWVFLLLLSSWDYEGPWQDHRLGHLFWGALLLWPFLCLSLVRSRMFHQWQ